ncbi:glutamine amidotransferase [bacterium]|nr:glutamine amidotransferase [bacterium]
MSHLSRCCVGVAALLSLLAVSPPAAAQQPLRVLLLQQSSAGQSQRTVAALEQTGLRVTWLTKDNIARMPATAEGLRREYDAILFGSLALEGGLDKVLSPEQLAALKGFVAGGGGLVTVIGEAGQALADVLPITAGPAAGPLQFQPVVVRPDHPAVQGLPRTWVPFGSRYNSFSKVALKPAAEALLEVPASAVGQAYPFLIAGRHGEGRVLCLNSLWCFSTGLQFRDWDWAPACFGQMARWAAGAPPLPPDQVKAIADPLWFWAFDRQAIRGVPELLNQPVTSPVEPAPPGVLSLRLDPCPPARDIPTVAPPRISETDGKLTITFANGLVADVDKRGMVGYRTSAGAIVAAEPVNETPVILFSGSIAPALTKTEGGESFHLQETLPGPKAPPVSFQYLGHEIRDRSVLVRFRMRVDNEEQGSLDWQFTPRDEVIEGTRWRGVGETMVLHSPRLFVEEVTPRHRWAPGGSIEGCSTFRSGCYSNPRGYGATEFVRDQTQDAGHFRWFSSGHPFQMFGSPRGTVWCHADSPCLVASWLAHQAGADYLQMVNKIGCGRVRGDITLPTLWYMTTDASMDHNLWLAAYDHLRGKYRAQFGLQPTPPVPTAMLRHEIAGFTDLRRYADAVVPLAQRLGYRRMDCGLREINDTMNPFCGGVEAFRYLCDKAHAAGLEVYIYAGAGWAKQTFPPLREHPEWVMRNREGQPLDSGYPDLWALSLRSGWWDYSLAQYARLRAQSGFDGVWLDSWTMPNEFINFAEAQARPTVVEAMRYLKALQDLGVNTWVEGQSPGTLESFWYRGDRYADLRGHEFILANTSPFAYNGDGLFDLDLYRLLSYHCAMFQDPRLLFRPEDKISQAAAHTNALMNRLHDTLGFPTRVREQPCGTLWECPRGWAVFAHSSRHVALSLPPGQYEVTALDTAEGFTQRPEQGRVVVSGTLPARSVLVITKR